MNLSERFFKGSLVRGLGDAKAPPEHRESKDAPIFKMRPVVAVVTVETVPGLICGTCHKPLTNGQWVTLKKVAEQHPSDLISAWHYPKCTPAEIAKEIL